MASFTKRKKADGSTAYQARITFKQNGEIIHRESKSFSKESLAKAWAKRRENEVEEQLALTGVVTNRMTFEQVARQYLAYLESQEKLKRTKRTTIAFLLTRPIASMDIAKITAKDILKHLRERIINDGAKPATVNNDLAYIGSTLRYAATMLDIPVNLNELALAKESAKANGLVGRSANRERRITQLELSALLSYFESGLKSYMVDVIEFAIHSGRRQSEITRLRWDDLDAKTHTIKVRDMKHPTLRGYTKTAKLTDRALKIIEQQPRAGELIFPREHKTISANFTRACHVLEIKDLRFHDLRHEATSRLFEAGYSIIEVQQFTLHENWATLKRYTHLKPQDVKLRD